MMPRPSSIASLLVLAASSFCAPKALAGELFLNDTAITPLSNSQPSIIDALGNVRVYSQDPSFICGLNASFPPSVSLAANPNPIPGSTGSTTLTWSVANAGGVCIPLEGTSAWRSLTNIFNTSAGGASQSFSISSGTNFRLVCSNSAGISQANVNVGVTIPTAPTVTLLATPSTIEPGQNSTISWDVSGADSCTPTGGGSTNWSSQAIGNGSGNRNYSLSSSTTFGLSCTNGGGTTSRSATVTVSGSAPSVTFTANPTTILAGQSSTLSWTVSGASSCTTSGGTGTAWGSQSVTNGSNQVSYVLNQTTTFGLSCSNSFGTSGPFQRTVTVNVPDNCAGLPAPPTGSFQDTSRNSLTSLFGSNATWGVLSGQATNAQFAQGQWVALQFTVPSAPPGGPSGRVLWAGSAFSGFFRVRVSECPGDFRTRAQSPTAPLALCTTETIPSAEDTIITGLPVSGWCPLEPGKTYYLNILAEACSGGTCQFVGQLAQ